MFQLAHNNPKLVNVVLLSLAAVIGVLVQQGIVPSAYGAPLATLLLGGGGFNATQKAPQ